MAHLSIALMGPFEVALDGKSVTWFQSDKVRALLAYLAVEIASPHARHTLAGLLWPHVPDAQALHSLSQALCNLRSVLHDKTTLAPCLLVTPHTVQFNCRCDHWVDVAEFGKLVDWESGRLVRRSGGESGHLVRHGDEAAAPWQPTNLPMYQSTNLQSLHQAVALYRGPFLEDLALADGAGFEEWATIQRERLHRLLLERLYRLAAAHEANGEFEEALHCVWRQLELDPWLEEAHFNAMRLLAGSGRRSEALAQYNFCRRLLAEELGVEPAAATTRLYEQIRDGALDHHVP
jgi:DNA-binding SARP family transcriptional activator